MKKLAVNDPDVKKMKSYLPECLCEENLKEALHNGGILVQTEQFANRTKTDESERQMTPQQLNLVKPGAADTRMLDITLADGETLTVRRSRCSLNIPTGEGTDSTFGARWFSFLRILTSELLLDLLLPCSVRQ